MIRTILIAITVTVMMTVSSASAKECPDPCPDCPTPVCPQPVCPEPVCPQPVCPSCSPTPICESTCVNDVTVVFQYDQQLNSCVKQFTIPCAPYECDNEGLTCKTSCFTDADCSQGAQCETSSGRCAVMANTCSDQNTVLMPNGTEIDCTPFACQAGVCQQTCTANSDCAPGYICGFILCVSP